MKKRTTEERALRERILREARKRAGDLETRDVDTQVRIFRNRRDASEVLADLREVGISVLSDVVHLSSARLAIEPLVDHPKTWIRQEARKALVRIDRATARRASRVRS
jgi:hypothetical protein